MSNEINPDEIIIRDGDDVFVANNIGFGIGTLGYLCNNCDDLHSTKVVVLSFVSDTGTEQVITFDPRDGLIDRLASSEFTDQLLQLIDEIS